MRKLIVAAALTALALPAASAAAKPSPHPESANRVCHQLRHDLGRATFRQTYGTNHNRANAMGRCRSAERRARAHDHTNAATTCKAEQAADSTAFTAKYGTGKHGHNALGKCISQTARAAAQDRPAEIEHAARACRTERAADRDAFRDTYGTNHNKRNALGMCVSASAKAHSA